jgi:hypothetical protein
MITKKFAPFIGVIALSLMSFQLYAETQDELFIFGNFRGSFNLIDDPICVGNCNTETNNDHDGVSFRNNASALGLRGSMTQDGVTGYFKYILRAHNDEIFNSGNAQTIIYTAGFKGAFGDVSYGVGSTPYKMSAMTLDPFWDTSASARGFDGPSIGLSDLVWGFSKNMLLWNSHELFENITIDAGIIVDDTNEDLHDYNIGARYSNDALSFGAQYVQLEESKAIAKSPGKGNASLVWANYEQNDWSVSASYEDISQDFREDQSHFFIASKVQLSKKTRLAVSYGQADIKDDVALDGKGGNIGVFYDILPNTEIYVLYSDISRDQTDDSSLVSVGVSHNFFSKIK